MRRRRLLSDPVPPPFATFEAIKAMQDDGEDLVDTCRRVWIRELLARGLSLDAVARELDYSRETVDELVDRYGISSSRKLAIVGGRRR